MTAGGDRTAAVLVLIANNPAGTYVVLVRRAASARHGGGELALPGGAIESGEDAVAAALREAAEEIALDPATVDVVGPGRAARLPVEDMVVTPVYARWRAPHPLVPAAAEVAEVVPVLVETLLRSARSGAGGAVEWSLPEGRVWGLTGYALAQLLDLVAPDWRSSVEVPA